MIDIAPELWPHGHFSSPNFSLFVQNLDYKSQSINRFIAGHMVLTCTMYYGIHDPTL